MAQCTDPFQRSADHREPIEKILCRSAMTQRDAVYNPVANVDDDARFCECGAEAWHVWEAAGAGRVRLMVLCSDTFSLLDDRVVPVAPERTRRRIASALAPLSK